MLQATIAAESPFGPEKIIVAVGIPPLLRASARRFMPWVAPMSVLIFLGIYSFDPSYPATFRNLNDYDAGAMVRHPSVLPSSRAHQNMGTRYGSDCDQGAAPSWMGLFVANVSITS